LSAKPSSSLLRKAVSRRTHHTSRFTTLRVSINHHINPKSPTSIPNPHPCSENSHTLYSIHIICTKYLYVHVHLYIHTHIYAYMYMYMYMYITCVHTYVRITCICIQTRMDGTRWSLRREMEFLTVALSTSLLL
jgi:hypothetical protein